MEILSIVVAIVALIFSGYAVYSQRQAETKLQRISFLLPELTRISRLLREPKFSRTEPHPPEHEIVEFYNKVRDICFHNEHILRAIGLGKELDIIITGEKGKQMDSISTLFKGLDAAFTTLLGTEGVPKRLV